MKEWINQNTDNGFRNDVSSLFKKDFIRMTSFSKVQHWPSHLIFSSLFLHIYFLLRWTLKKGLKKNRYSDEWNITVKSIVNNLVYPQHFNTSGQSFWLSHSPVVKSLIKVNILDGGCSITTVHLAKTITQMFTVTAAVARIYISIPFFLSFLSPSFYLYLYTSISFNVKL